MITELGGAVAVPSAVRSSDSTTTMRVNDVIMIRIDGAIDSTVSSAINWIARSVTPPPPWPRLMLMSCASAGSASDPAAIRLRKIKLYAEMSPASRRVLRTAQQGRHLVFEILKAALLRSGGGNGRLAAGGTGGRRFRRHRRRDRSRPAGAARLPAAAPFRRDLWSALDGAGAAGGGRRRRRRRRVGARARRRANRRQRSRTG